MMLHNPLLLLETVGVREFLLAWEARSPTVVVAGTELVELIKTARTLRFAKRACAQIQNRRERQWEQQQQDTTLSGVRRP
jgi:tRNA A37 N6-isopentenylltransferase MiaA